MAATFAAWLKHRPPRVPPPPVVVDDRWLSYEKAAEEVGCGLSTIKTMVLRANSIPGVPHGDTYGYGRVPCGSRKPAVSATDSRLVSAPGAVHRGVRGVTCPYCGSDDTERVGHQWLCNCCSRCWLAYTHADLFLLSVLCIAS